MKSTSAALAVNPTSAALALNPTSAALAVQEGKLHECTDMLHQLQNYNADLEDDIDLLHMALLPGGKMATEHCRAAETIRGLKQ